MLAIGKILRNRTDKKDKMLVWFRPALLQKSEVIFGQYFEWRDCPNIEQLNIDQILPETSSNTIGFSGDFRRYLGLSCCKKVRQYLVDILNGRNAQILHD
jgi:hypothetical protein